LLLHLIKFSPPPPPRHYLCVLCLEGTDRHFFLFFFFFFFRACFPRSVASKSCFLSSLLLSSILD
jgi:hypothetical protein